MKEHQPTTNLFPVDCENSGFPLKLLLLLKELQSSQALLCLFELLFTILDYTFYAMVNLRGWCLQALSSLPLKSCNGLAPSLWMGHLLEVRSMI